MGTLFLSSQVLRRAVYAVLRDLRGEDCTTIWWHTKNYLRDRNLLDEGMHPTVEQVYASLQELCAAGKVMKYATHRSVRPIAYSRKILS